MKLAESQTKEITTADYDPAAAGIDVTVDEMYFMAQDIRMTLLSYMTGNALVRVNKYMEHTMLRANALPGARDVRVLAALILAIRRDGHHFIKPSILSFCRVIFGVGQTK